MPFDLRVDPPEKCHLVYPCVMTRNHPKKLYEDGVLMLLFPGDLVLITCMGHQIPPDCEKILIQGPRKV